MSFGPVQLPGVVVAGTPAKEKGMLEALQHGSWQAWAIIIMVTYIALQVLAIAFAIHKSRTPAFSAASVAPAPAASNYIEQLIAEARGLTQQELADEYNDHCVG